MALSDLSVDFTTASGGDMDNFDASEFLNFDFDAKPPARPPPPKRLPNGRFMSKSQIEAFNNGVSIEEIVQLAAVADYEKKLAKATDDNDMKERKMTPTVKKKVMKKPEAPTVKATDSKFLPTATTSSAGNVERFGTVISQMPAQNSQPPQMQQHYSHQSQPQFQQIQQSQIQSTRIQIVNGQPVIQARLEQIRTADGGTVTVAVLPADVHNLLRANGLALPHLVQQIQQQQQQPVVSVSPNLMVRLPGSSSPAPPKMVPIQDQRFMPIQPKMKVVPAVKSANNAEVVAKQPIVAPHHLPSERFTFRLSADDERAVAELTSQIAKIQGRQIRNPVDDAVLVQLEEQRSAILHRAASSQFQAMSVSKGHQNGAITTNVSQSPQVVQINGMQYVAVPSSNAPKSNQLIIKGNDGFMFNSSGTGSPMNITGTEVPHSTASQTMPKRKKMEKLPEDPQSIMNRRCERVNERLDLDQNNATQPDCDTPFRDKKDAVSRLLPYHLHEEPNVQQRLLSSVDTDFESFMERCSTKMQSLFDRFYKVLDSMAPMSSSMDELIVQDLLMKDEKRALAEEREEAAKSPGPSIQYLREVQKVDFPTMDPEPSEVEAGNTKSLMLRLKKSTVTDIVKDAHVDQESKMPLLSPQPATNRISPSKEIASSRPPPQVEKPMEIDLGLVPGQSQSTSQMASPSRSALASGIRCDEQIEARISVKVVIRKRRLVEESKPSTSSDGIKEIYVTESTTDTGGHDFFASMDTEGDEEGTLRVPPLKIRLRCNKDPDPAPTNKDCDPTPDSTPMNKTPFNNPDSTPTNKNQPGRHFLGLDSSDSDNEESLEAAEKRNVASASSAILKAAEPPSVQLSDNSSISGNEDDEEKNSATTTSPGDSGNDAVDEDNDTESDPISLEQRSDQNVNNERAIPPLKLFRSSDFASSTKNNRLNILSVTRWKRVDKASATKHSMDSADNEASDDDDNESM